MERFNKLVYQIIMEQKFKSSKWTYVHSVKDVKQFMNEEHMSQRSSERYDKNFIDFGRVAYIMDAITHYFIEHRIFQTQTSQKFNFTRPFAVHAK